MDIRGIKEFFVDSIKYITLICIVFLIVIYVCSLQQVIGPSMMPNFNDKDVLLTNKLLYRFREPTRFEIVTIFHEEGNFLIKRIIGLPGDTLFYKDNILFINEEELEEPFLSNIKTEDFSLEELGYDVIPNNMYLVLGDNREDSLDSRHFGLIEKKQLIGKPFIRIFPFKKISLIN